MRKELVMLCVCTVAIAAVGCDGQRSDMPAKDSEAQSALEKGIPKSAVDGSRQNQPSSQNQPAPEVTP